MDGVVVPDRVLQALEHQYAAAVGVRGAVGGDVEGAAVAVAGEGAAGGVEVAAPGGRAGGGGAREDHVGLVGEQALHRQVDGDQ